MCTNLIRGYRSRERSPKSGRRGLVTSLRKGLHDLPAVVPCQQCMECRLKKSREDALRCVHEASLHDENSVVTLTYAPEHLPRDGGLNPPDAVKFIKDLRAWEDYHAGKEGKPPRRFITWGCAEYGEKGGRPHYHIILFGYDFRDKEPYGHEPGYYTSDILTQIWGKGQTQIMDLTFESAAYVARYITKKLNISVATPQAKAKIIKEKYGDKLPEQTVCLTQKGLGKEWYNEWKKEIYNGDIVYRSTKDGKRIPMTPPKYYDRRYEIEHNEQYERIKNARKIKNQKRMDKIRKEIEKGNTTNAMNQGIGSRDMADQACKEAAWKQLKRGYENES